MKALSRRGKVTLIAILIFLVGETTAVIKHQPTPLPSPTPSQSTVLPNCDESLWNHVYHPARLIRLTPDCLTVTGTIDFIRKEKDGDDHIGLKLDPGQEQYLTDGNINFEKGDLVLEPVCELPVSQNDAVSACLNYHSNIIVPPIGTHVSVTGFYVADTIHKPVHHEIHPVTSITPL